MSRKDLTRIATGLAQRSRTLRERLEQASGRPLEVRPRLTGTVYLLLDCSGSMEECLREARTGAAGFASEAQRGGYKVGLGTFASGAAHLLDPQPGMDEVVMALSRISADGSTNMAEGIKRAGDHLRPGAGERILCVVTDGLPDSEPAALAAARALRENGVDIMALGTGDADHDFLRRLVSRESLAIHVEAKRLGSGITAMAKLLPRPSGDTSEGSGPR